MFSSTRTILIITLLLIASFGPIGSSAPLVPAAIHLPCEVPENGKWSLVQGQQVTCEDTTIIVQSIKIGQLASLTLINTEVIVDAQVDSTGTNGGVSKIEVSGNSYNTIPGYGGALYAYDSVFRAQDPNIKPDSIMLNGAATLVMHNSEIRDFYVGIASHPDPEKIEVIDSRFSTHHDAILLFDALNVLIEGNLFTGPGDGVMVRDGPTGVIRDNTFTNCVAAIYLYGEEVTAEEISGNTITNCQVGLAANNCHEQSIHDNDVFRNLNKRGRNLPTFETGMCGDLSMNWWGETGPDVRRFGRPVDVTPWRSEPVHPERLPTAHITPPAGVIYAGKSVTLSAEGSSPSLTWNSPLASFVWDFGPGPDATGEVVEHTFRQPGTYEVSVLVTDELGISRMAFVEVDVL